MSGPYSNIRRTQNRCPTGVSAKDWQIQELLKQGYEDSSAIPGTATSGDGSGGNGYSSSGASGIEDNSFYFDSTSRIQSTDLASGEVTFSITNLNANNDVQNCIQMSLDKMFFPRLTVSANQPDPFFYRRVLVQVVNAPSTQAVFGQNNNKFHFEMEVDNLTSVAVMLTAIKPMFYFQRPVTSFSEIQLRFMTPDFRRIAIPKDVLSVVAIAGSNPAQFNVINGDTTSPIGPVGVPAPPGVAVYFSGFNTGDANFDNNVNSSLGQYITTINSTSQFTVANLNFATLAVNTPATMTIGKNRINFVMRFTSLRSQSTNFVQPVHI